MPYSTLDPLNIEASQTTPAVSYDPAHAVFSVKGNAYHENIGEFFDNIFDWMEHYLANPPEKSHFEFEMKYMNSTGLKNVMLLINHLNQLVALEKELSIKWYYEEHDEDIKETGNKLAMITKVDMELVPIEDA